MAQLFTGKTYAESEPDIGAVARRAAKRGIAADSLTQGVPWSPQLVVLRAVRRSMARRQTTAHPWLSPPCTCTSFGLASCATLHRCPGRRLVRPRVAPSSQGAPAYVSLSASYGLLRSRTRIFPPVSTLTGAVPGVLKVFGISALSISICKRESNFLTWSTTMPCQ